MLMFVAGLDTLSDFIANNTRSPSPVLAVIPPHLPRIAGNTVVERQDDGHVSAEIRLIGSFHGRNNSQLEVLRVFCNEMNSQQNLGTRRGLQWFIFAAETAIHISSSFRSQVSVSNKNWLVAEARNWKTAICSRLCI